MPPGKECLLVPPWGPEPREGSCRCSCHEVRPTVGGNGEHPRREHGLEKNHQGPDSWLPIPLHGGVLSVDYA